MKLFAWFTLLKNPVRKNTVSIGSNSKEDLGKKTQCTVLRLVFVISEQFMERSKYYTSNALALEFFLFHMSLIRSPLWWYIIFLKTPNR